MQDDPTSIARANVQHDKFRNRVNKRKLLNPFIEFAFSYNARNQKSTNSIAYKRS